MARKDDDVNLEQLKLLKQIFEEADADGSGELDIDEFVEKLGPYLGGATGTHLSSVEDVRQLFMKIDADAGGTVDWDEFTNFMFLERSQMGGEGASENWRLFPQDFRDRNDPSVYHRGPVDKLLYVEPIDKYVSCGRDGTFRLWNGTDLRHFKTIGIGSSWVTGAIYMPMARKLVFTTIDRAISYYDANRGSFELTGRVYASGGMGVPQTMTLVTNEAGEQLVYGDSKGGAVMLLCGTREWPARDMISTDEHQDYIYIHQEHKDWVSHIEWVPEIGLVSSSLDATIKVYDFVREKVINTCTHHLKAVHSFIWCRAYSMFASCGQERDVVLWQGNTMRKIGDLTGHTASVTHIELDERLNHVFTLSADKVIKVWDLRNHKCLQTICQDDWLRPEESRPSCITYDSMHRRVITAVTKPYVWVHKMVAQDRTGHMDAVRAALYNTVFGVVVSVDEGGTCCVWNLASGSREGRFTHAHGDSRVTAACFDKNERRLLTAANDGSVRMWNFNNGSLLKQYKHGEEALEVSCVVYAADEKRSSDAIYAAGWNCKVFVWEDQDTESGVVDEYRTFEGHREDVTHMATFAPRQLLAAGDYEGRINIYNLFTGERRMSLYHRAERYETSVEKLLWVAPPPLQKRGVAASQASPLLLLSHGGDGLMRIWHISTTGKLLCTLPAAQGRLDVVSACCATTPYDHVLVADTSGHIRVWSIAGGVDASSTAACRDSFRQRAHWLAHEAPINGLSTVPGRDLVIAACKDFNVSIWNMDGAMVGILGEHSWRLDDPATWVDAKGEKTKPPLPKDTNLYLADPEGAEAAAASEADGARGGRAGGRVRMTKPEGGAPGAAGDVAGEGVDADEDEVCKDYTPIQRATLRLDEKRARVRDAEHQLPMGAHSLLEVHKLQEVPASAKDLLHPGQAQDRRKGRPAGGGNVVFGAKLTGGK